ncbi:MAG TPA: cbb3-type cytochrome c oxidase subunit I, partial [Thermoanaerobaculia bacterium]|nr:cbb3-type cytochrome c oxidase subunit I [Thermoanaerobaculia bacterium]
MSQSEPAVVEDLDRLIDRDLIRKWLYWGLFWVMFAPTIGVIVSTKFSYPDFLGTLPYTTFGRLRPIHVNGVIFGAFSTLFIGLCYYIVPRLTGTRIYRERLGHAIVWVWNLGLLAGFVSLALGYNHGMEAGEFPLAVGIVVFIA